MHPACLPKLNNILDIYEHIPCPWTFVFVRTFIVIMQKVFTFLVESHTHKHTHRFLVITYYFNYHEDGHDASEKGHVHHDGDISGRSSEAVPPLEGGLGVGGAGLCANFGWEVCHGLRGNRWFGNRRSNNQTPTVDTWVSSSEESSGKVRLSCSTHWLHPQNLQTRKRAHPTLA